MWALIPLFFSGPPATKAIAQPVGNLARPAKAQERPAAPRRWVLLAEKAPRDVEDRLRRAADAADAPGPPPAQITRQGDDWLVTRKGVLLLATAGNGRFPLALPPFIPDEAVRAAEQRHKHWLALGALNDSPSAAQFVQALLKEKDSPFFAVHRPETGETRLAAAPNLAAWLGEPPGTQEAKRRWGEFKSAWLVRQPNQPFAAKAAFLEGPIREDMWVLIDRLDGDALFGRLDGEPKLLKSKRRGDSATIAAADLLDWMYKGPAGLIGGFTTQSERFVERPRVKFPVPAAAP